MGFLLPRNRQEYSLSLRYLHQWCFVLRSWHLWGWYCEHPPKHRPQSLSVPTSCLRWKCGEPYNPLDVHRCRLSGHTLLSLHCRQSQRCRDPRSVCYHTHIIANRKLCTWLYVHSTLQIARHRVHRITRGEVKVIPIEILAPQLATTLCQESEDFYQTQRHAPLISCGWYERTAWCEGLWGDWGVLWEFVSALFTIYI